MTIVKMAVVGIGAWLIAKKLLQYVLSCVYTWRRSTYTDGRSRVHYGYLLT